MAANTFGHKYGYIRMVDNSEQLNNFLAKCTVDDDAEERIVILRSGQPIKASVSIILTDSGKSIDDRLVQLSNAA